MKKTLQETKERFYQIVEQGATNMAYGFKPTENDENPELNDPMDEFIKEGEPLNMAIVEFINNLEAKGLSREQIHQELMGVVQAAIQGDTDMESNSEILDEPIDEYGEQYDKNMSQGFSSINEGNAFVGAVKKAKEEGKDSFKLDGKTYKVTVSKSKK